MATYDDMMRLGARCDVCPLRSEGRGPCASEILPGTEVLLVGQEPGNAEIDANRPFAGRAGGYVDDVLKRIGVSRFHVSTTSVVACMPPGGDITAYEGRLRSKNGRRVKAGQGVIPTPTACCAPRLHREAAPFRTVVPMGSPAVAQMVLGVRGGAMATRGRLLEVPAEAVDARVYFDSWADLHEAGVSPASVPGRRVVPALNPAYVLRESQWDEVFTADVDRAFRWHRGAADLVRPRLLLRPDIDTMARVLEGTHPDWPAWEWNGLRVTAYDWETDDIHAMTARPRCIGIGTPEWAMVVPMEPVQWGRHTRERRATAAKIRAKLEAEGLGRSDAIARSFEAVAERDWEYEGDWFFAGGYERAYRMNDGSSLPLYDEAERAERDRWLRWWVTHPGIWKIGWNSGQYDRIVSESYFGVTPAPHRDAILAKRSVQPETPNDLSFAGSHFLDIHDWKGDHWSGENKTDEDEWRYNGIDVVATAKLWPILVDRLEARRQVDVFELDHKMQAACVGMHRLGMGVDQAERERLDTLLASPGKAKVRTGYDKATRTVTMKEIKQGSIHHWTTQARRVLQGAGVDVSGIVKRTKKADARHAEWLEAASLEEREAADEDVEDAEALQGALPSAAELGLDVLTFNPFSSHQLRALLFEEWEVPIPTDLANKELYTSSGDLSTSDAVLRRLYVSPALTQPQRDFLFAIRMARRHAKVWGTYVRPFRFPEGDVILDKGCRVWTDGRLHPSWNAHTAVTGRFASSGPNAQNLPGAAKAMIIAQPGCVLVGADMDQLELRIAAARWGAARYLEAFAKGIDPHQMTMEAVFGRARMMAFQGAPSTFGAKDFAKKSEFENMRKLAKAIQYASQYAAGCALRSGRPQVVDTHTVFRLVTSAEDKEKGVLLFADLSESDVAVMHEAWLRGCPEFPDGWMAELRTVQAQGFIAEPVTGRRRDFVGRRARKLNEIANFPIQASAAGLMNRMLEDLVDRIPFEAWGPGTGIVNQCHDSITVECPEGEAEAVLAILNECMNVTHPAFPGVTFSAEAEIGWRHKDPMGQGQSRWSMT